MAGNIIPAIATTNAMTASLCVLEAFKVMRDELQKAKMVFLTRSTERVLSNEPLRPPNPTCPVCSVAQTTLVVDTSRATLNDLVEDLLRLQLGYGPEFSVNSETGILYDFEEVQNLSKTFKELGLKNDSFITIIDEADEDTKVNLTLSISEKSLEEETKPIHLAENVQIATKPRADPPAVTTAPVVTNGSSAVTNGHAHTVANGIPNGKRKRSIEEADLENDIVKKRGKVVAAPDDDVVVVDDAEDGAILIDD
jgi:ubiquitin-like 1-activating enzyme E1 B